MANLIVSASTTWSPSASTATLFSIVCSVMEDHYAVGSLDSIGDNSVVITVSQGETPIPASELATKIASSVAGQFTVSESDSTITITDVS